MAKQFTLGGFGAALKQIREDRGMSQTDLALASNVSRQQICGYENGAAAPGFSAAWALANALGCSLDELGGRTWPQAS